MTRRDFGGFNALAFRSFRFLTLLFTAAGIAAAPAAAAERGYATTPAQADGTDPTYRALFDSWKKLDGNRPIMAIPSAKPVEGVTLTSSYGVRSDPFRGGAAMHAGIDLAGPIGTAIYATADGIVGRAGWASGYGNLVELDHGRGIQTRYGHLSQMLVKPGQRVKRGDLIARMGSTGRSTGSHLHYEVRLDGRAVSPLPYMQTADHMAAIEQRGANQIALGGPEDEADPVAADRAVN